jgi:hypothetical protein
MIDVAAEFCFWTEQRQNGSSIFRLGLAETPEVPNTISDDNSLSCRMVHQTDPKRLVIYEVRQSKTRPVAESAFLADHTFLYKTGFWCNFAMTTLETSYMKNAPTISAFCWLLIRLILTHGFVITVL